MKGIELDLAQPFEKVLATALSLPAGCASTRIDRLANEAEFKQVVRRLYEAANGRQVEAAIGMIAIAPPVAPFLKAKPFQVATQLDLMVEAATRIIGAPGLSGTEVDNSKTLSRSEPKRSRQPNPTPKLRSRTRVRTVSPVKQRNRAALLVCNNRRCP